MWQPLRLLVVPLTHTGRFHSTRPYIRRVTSFSIMSSGNVETVRASRSAKETWLSKFSDPNNTSIFQRPIMMMSLYWLAGAVLTFREIFSNKYSWFSFLFSNYVWMDRLIFSIRESALRQGELSLSIITSNLQDRCLEFSIARIANTMCGCSV